MMKLAIFTYAVLAAAPVQAQPARSAQAAMQRGCYAFDVNADICHRYDAVPGGTASSCYDDIYTLSTGD